MGCTGSKRDVDHAAYSPGASKRDDIGRPLHECGAVQQQFGYENGDMTRWKRSRTSEHLDPKWGGSPSVPQREPTSSNTRDAREAGNSASYKPLSPIVDGAPLHMGHGGGSSTTLGGGGGQSSSPAGGSAGGSLQAKKSLRKSSSLNSLVLPEDLDGTFPGPPSQNTSLGREYSRDHTSRMSDFERKVSKSSNSKITPEDQGGGGAARRKKDHKDHHHKHDSNSHTAKMRRSQSMHS